jgi:hypothetical protein
MLMEAFDIKENQDKNDLIPAALASDSVGLCK